MIEDKLGLRPLLDLRNAIIERAVWDFEMLISEAPIPVGMFSCPSEMTVPAIRQFARGTNIEIWLDKIERIYYEKFQPYAREHAEEIIKAWKKHKRIRSEYGRELDLKTYKHKCPLCGGVLKPMTICGIKCIGCSFCYLNVKVPRKEA